MKTGVLLAALTAVVACAAPSSQASAPAPVVFAANRAPTVAGEIYRLDPNGARIDLSRSPAQDTTPVVSSDGRRVAFLSDRGGRPGVYEVGIDGGGLVAVARWPSLDQVNSSLAWQPNGAQLALDNGRSVSILQRGYKPITFRKTRFGAAQPWSPDGQVLLLSQGLSTLRAVSPQGFTLWKGNENVYPVGGWSSRGLVAVSSGRGVRVYDEVGRQRFGFHLPTTPEAIAWSRDGTRLAVEWGASHTNLNVRSLDGKQLLAKRLPTGGNLGWNGDRKVILGEPCFGCQTISVDVATGTVAPGSSRWLEPTSADGTLALYERPNAPGFDLGVSPLPRGAARAYRNVPSCMSDGVSTPAVSFPQFAGHSIVYQSWDTTCEAPLDNLYAKTGARIHRLTTVNAEEKQPALSPDGTEIAYVWAQALGMNCKGCADGIRIASATGKAIRTLTDPADCTFDDSPSWSPDGTSILYSETGCDNPGELYTVPEAGGAPTDLHLAGVNPAWGPVRIAYQGALNTAGGIWTANPDGSDPVQIAAHGERPAYSATGALAYLVGKSVVWDGNVHPLPFTAVASLAWSADGTRFHVVAKTARSASFDLYSVHLDGTHPVRLTKNYGVAGKP